MKKHGDLIGLPDNLKHKITGILESRSGSIIISGERRAEGKIVSCSRCRNDLSVDSPRGTLHVNFVPVLCDRCRARN